MKLFSTFELPGSKMITRIDTHPRYLKKSNIPLTIVCGPPCSGKTTYVQKHKTDGDWIIDLDVIQSQIDSLFRPWQETNFKLLRRAIDLRNKMLVALTVLKNKKAFFIVAAPTQAERNWWQMHLGGEVVLLNVAPDECKRRAIARGTPQAAQGIDDWFEKSEQLWIQPQYHQAIAIDGWPRDDDDG